jgi:hypothetical protein
MASHRVLVLAASIPFFVLASIFVGLCTISSIFVVKKLKLNDYLMLLAWVCDEFLSITPQMAMQRG